jgi:hypothetical protein
MLFVLPSASQEVERWWPPAVLLLLQLLLLLLLLLRFSDFFGERFLNSSSEGLMNSACSLM